MNRPLRFFAFFFLCLVVILGLGATNSFCGNTIEDFRKAAEQGDANAQYNLGMAYLDGKGVPKDEKEALKWFLKAAEKGHAQAQTGLGYIYSSGSRAVPLKSDIKNVPADPAEARRWFLKAAERGYAPAQLALGEEYLQSDKNVPEALKWIRKPLRSAR